ncbi:DUF4145 domain-containing protein [Hoeflea alexandrii]|uniref:DUF4145 domain-containing protein n=1 Tax=Hoeflea alexandrii TaxID=288436 RepID=UPI0022AF32F3|nr:DUF4145 domain-containing protein [Hoeflea alexandrii]MCZ4288681.1 DUF4145 domain-containing protein [Hoeflea alexandrii]
MQIKGFATQDDLNYEMFMVCNACGRGSIYQGQPKGNFADDRDLETGRSIRDSPVQIYPEIPKLSDDIPARTRDLFRQAATCLRYGLSEPAGAMFRKTIDVGTKEFYSNNERLKDKQPANALRSRLKALGDMKVLDEDIVELADIAALDGNDATHDEDPYTTKEAEALEELTIDLLDRLFVRPATIARVRAKQIASGLRKADTAGESDGV